MINAKFGRAALATAALALSSAAMAASVTIATQKGSIADGATIFSEAITLTSASSASFVATLRGTTAKPGDIISFSLLNSAGQEMALSNPAQDVSVFGRETITNFYGSLSAGVYTLKLTSAATGGGAYSFAGSYNVATTPVPEPLTTVLSLAGVAAILVTRRKRQA